MTTHTSMSVDELRDKRNRRKRLAIKINRKFLWMSEADIQYLFEVFDELHRLESK